MGELFWLEYTTGKTNRQQDNIKVDVWKIGLESVNWINLA
jgi:hypothetical protein